MVATLVISGITFALLGTSMFLFPSFHIKKLKIDTYWIIALIGALILLASTLVPIKEVGHQLFSDEAINPLKVLILFFSMTLLSAFLDETGLFKAIATFASNKAKSSQFALFLSFYALTSILTIFTSNDVVILTLTPFLCFFAKHAKINPLPYLLAEFVAANTYSMFLIIGNPTNIYLASMAGIPFFEYMKVMAIPTIFAGIVELGLLLLLFHKQLRKPLETKEEHYKIEDKADLWIGVAHLGVTLVLLSISNFLHWQMWLITLIAAISLLISVSFLHLFTHHNFNDLGHTFTHLPYPLIPFFLSMFVIVVGFNYQGISAALSNVLGSQNPIFVYGYSSFFMANLINNIPMSILYASLPVGLEGSAQISAIYATIIGSNIGAFLTPLGALAGIMFSGLLNQYEVKFSFFDFVKYGFVIALPTITVALLGLWLSLSVLP